MKIKKDEELYPIKIRYNMPKEDHQLESNQKDDTEISFDNKILDNKKEDVDTSKIDSSVKNLSEMENLIKKDIADDSLQPEQDDFKSTEENKIVGKKIYKMYKGAEKTFCKVREDFDVLAQDLNFKGLLNNEEFYIDSSNVFLLTKTGKGFDKNNNKKSINDELKMDYNLNHDHEYNVNIQNRLKTDKKMNDNISFENTLEFKSKSLWTERSEDKKIKNYEERPKILKSFSNTLSNSNKVILTPEKNVKDVVSVNLSETITNRKISSISEIKNSLSFRNVLYDGEKGNISLNNNILNSLNYKYSVDYNNNSDRSFNITKGVSTSLTYVPNKIIHFEANANGTYTLSTAKDSYSFGAKLKTDIKPMPKENLKLSLGAEYTQSNQINPENNKNLNQKISISADVDFDKDFGINTSYDIHLDKNNDNNFNIGLKFNL